MESHVKALPEFPKFRELSFEDKNLVDAVLTRVQPEISELTFTNLFVWSEADPVQLARTNETVIVQRWRSREVRNVLLPPLTSESILSVLDVLKETSKQNGVETLIYGLNSEQVSQIGSRYEVQEDRDDWDYVYLSSDLADLPGDKYHPKRNFVARCLAEHKCEYAKLEGQAIDDCLKLQTEWCNLRQCDSDSGLGAENRAVKTTLENYAKMGVFGGSVYVDGKLEAFTIAEQLNTTTAVIHFEKANPQITGLYQVINQWFSQKELRKFLYVNREQDLGIQGLRKAKLSYHPHHIVEKYITTVTPALAGRSERNARSLI